MNRFITQAVAGVPLTVYGKGGQTRGYLNLIDTLQCVELAMNTPADKGQLRILNQFVELFSVNDIAQKVKRVGDGMGLNVTVEPIENPRKEKEDHYYNAHHSGLDELGLKPNPDDRRCGRRNDGTDCCLQRKDRQEKDHAEGSLVITDAASAKRYGQLPEPCFNHSPQKAESVKKVSPFLALPGETFCYVDWPLFDFISPLCRVDYKLRRVILILRKL